MSISAVCAAAAELSQEYGLRYFLLFKGFTCIIAAVLPIILIRNLGISWLIHPNAKVLFCTHLFWMVQMPCSYAFVYIYDYWRLSQSSSDPCSFVVSVSFSLYTRTPAVAGFTAQMFTMFAFCLERALSTLHPYFYERMQTASIGIFLAFFSSIFSIVFSYYMLFHGVDMDALQASYGVRTAENANGFQIMLNVQFIVEVLTLLIFSLSLWRNERQYHRISLGPGQHQLATKYQTSENRRLIRILLPVVLLHFFFLASNAFGLMMLQMFCPNCSSLQHKVFMEINGEIHLYSLIAPLVLLFLCRRKNSFVASVTDTVEHFKVLHDLFNQPLANRRKGEILTSSR